MVLNATSMMPAEASTWIPCTISLRSIFSFMESFTLAPSTPRMRTFTVSPTVTKSDTSML